MTVSEKSLINQLNNLNSAAHKAKLGQVLEDLIVNYNLLQASHADLLNKYGNLLAHLDTANVTGIGAANAATYGSAATTAATIKTLNAR